MAEESLKFICDNYHNCVNSLEITAETLEIMNKRGWDDINSARKSIEKNLACATSSYNLGLLLINLNPIYESQEDASGSSLETAATKFKRAHAELCFEYVTRLPWGENI